MGLLLRVALAALTFAALSVWSRPASAYGWMIRHGYGGCTTCHADPSGGETLTRYGRAQSDLLLRMRYGKDSVSAGASETSAPKDDSFDSFDEDLAGDAPKPKQPAPKPEPEAVEETGPSSSSGFSWGLFEPPDFMLLGGSLRTVGLLSGGDFRYFPMQADLYGQLAFGPVKLGGSLGAAKVKEGSPHARAAQVTTNQGDELNLISRTHWVGLDLGGRGDLLLRAGRLNLPFGIRMSEHVMWVREATRTDRESDQQHGAALAYSGMNLRAEVMAIAGNYQLGPDKYRERGYSLYVEALASKSVAAGASSLLTFAKADRITLEQESTARGAHGAFARFAPAGALAVLVEADALHTSRRDLGYVGFAQLDYELTQGLHLGATGEALDIGYQQQPSGNLGIDLPRQVGAGKPRFGGWLTVDWFFLPHCELRVDAIVRQESAFTLLSQLHVFL